MAAGAAVYAHACVACHETDGSGAPKIYPPLPGNANLQSADPSSTLRIILDGAQTLTTPRAPNTGSMPAYANQFSDQEIADALSLSLHKVSYHIHRLERTFNVHNRAQLAYLAARRVRA